MMLDAGCMVRAELYFVLLCVLLSPPHAQPCASGGSAKRYLVLSPRFLTPAGSPSSSTTRQL